MVGALRVVAYPGVDGRVRGNPRARLDLGAAVGIEGLLADDLAGQADAGAEAGAVVLVRQVVEQDARLVPRIGRLDPHVPAALRLVGADVDLEAVALERGLAVVAHGRGQEVVLDVRPLDAGPGADEGAGFEVVGGAEAVLEQDPARPDQELGPGVELGVERDRLGAAELKVDLEMVAQILADPGQVVGDLDPGRAQNVARTDAGQLQELRRADRAGGQDHLARRLGGDAPAPL